MGVLTALGFLINLYPVPLFFSVDLLFGSIAPVASILVWGSWWSIPMAAIVSLPTLQLWGHPYAIIIFSLEALFLWGLSRKTSPSSLLDHKIIRIDIFFWLTGGLLLNFIFYYNALNLNLISSLTVYLKQATNGILNTCIVSIVFLALSVYQLKNTSKVSIKVLIFGSMLGSILASSLLISTISNFLFYQTVVQGQIARFTDIARLVVRSGDRDEPLERRNLQSLSIVQVLDQKRSVSCVPVGADQEKASVIWSSRDRCLNILLANNSTSGIKEWVNGNWYFEFLLEPNRFVSIKEPSRESILKIQQNSSYLLLTLFLTSLAGYGLSRYISSWLSAQFATVLSHVQLTAPREVSSASPGADDDFYEKSAQLHEIQIISQAIESHVKTNRLITEDLADINERLQVTRKELELESITDQLTDVFNRRAFDQWIAVECENAKRHNTQLSCLLFDVDHFKQINDAYGHQIGDAALKAVAECVKGHLRQTDKLFRIGGDEFAVLVVGQQVNNGDEHLAQKLCELVNGLEIGEQGRRFSISCSIGVARFNHAIDSTSSLIAKADKALYESKLNGRNTVSVSTYVI